MSEQEQPDSAEKRRPPSGPVSSPRAYFGRASRAATGASRGGISETPEPGAAAAPKRPVYRAGDPALRLFAGFVLAMPPTTPLTGAIAMLSGIRDGEHEKLFIDLGTSLVRATPRREVGTLSLVLSRMQSAEMYGALLASLRYVNDAEAPTNGVRQIALRAIDAGGRAQDVATALFGVGEAPPEPNTALAASDERVVIGEQQSFNSDGDYTLFWWPRLLPAPAERARRANPAEAEPDGPAGSYFSAGGKLYRLFGPEIERPAPPPVAAPVPRTAPPVGRALLAANDRAPAHVRAMHDQVWMPGRGVPPPGFERARMLRLEDVFGSDMQGVIARRLIKHRLAAGG